MSASELILSDAVCPRCNETVGVQWLFKAFFSLVIAVATTVVGLVVLVDQGPYAALLIISLPVGAIGYIKARFCPLVVRVPAPDAEGRTS